MTGKRDERGGTVDRVDPLRLTVVWAPGLPRGKEIGEALARHFDALGMVRDRRRIGVPVRIRCASLADGSPRPIDWCLAANHVVVFLADAELVSLLVGPWKRFHEDVVATQNASAGAVKIIPVAMTDLGDTLPGVTETEPERFYDYASEGDVSSDKILSDEPVDDVRRLLLVIMSRCGGIMRAALAKLPGAPLVGSSGQAMKVFLSHAHRDGRAFVAAVDHRLKQISGTRAGIEAFLDSKALVVGENYREGFEAAIRDGMFVAIHTDDYTTRRWCRWEMLCAKRHQAPIVVAQMLNRGENRSFPYAGNTPLSVIQAATEATPVLSPVAAPSVPTRRFWQLRKIKPITAPPPSASVTPNPESDWLVSAAGRRAIDNLLISICSEALRFFIFFADAARATADAPENSVLVLPRPPELADLAVFKRSRRERGLANEPAAILYPDPPLDTAELELIDELSTPLVSMTLSQYTASRALAPNVRPEPTPANLLADRIVGISLSTFDARESALLGFATPSPKLAANWQALAEVATIVAQLGGRIGYGGDFRDLHLFEEVADAYRTAEARAPAAYINYLAWSVWTGRKRLPWALEPAKLFKIVSQLSGIGEVRLFLPSGDYLRVIAQTVGKDKFGEDRVRLTTIPHGASAAPFAGSFDSPEALEQRLYLPAAALQPQHNALTVMRRAMASDDWARVLIGGRTKGYSGDFPGAVEEAIEAIRAEKLVFPLAAFGGSTLFTAHALGLIEGPPPIATTETGKGFNEAMKILADLRSDYNAVLANYGVPRAIAVGLATAESPETIAFLFRRAMVLAANARVMRA